MVGNLLENACKWTRKRVAVGVRQQQDMLVIDVRDDGPGLPPEALAEAPRRGSRLDESVQGSGLGLSIVRDIAGLYGGALVLDRAADLGGLRATIRLPAAPAG